MNLTELGDIYCHWGRVPWEGIAERDKSEDLPKRLLRDCACGEWAGLKTLCFQVGGGTPYCIIIERTCDRCPRLAIAITTWLPTLKHIILLPPNIRIAASRSVKVYGE